MNEKEYLNSSEKLLHTDIRVLLGGKGFNIPESKPFIGTPPPPETLDNSNDNGGPNRLPELVNSSVDEVLSSPPVWLIRWGTSVFFLIFVLFFAVTWFVEYPDLIPTNIKLVSNNLPKTIISKSDGNLTRLFVKESQFVAKDEVLAYLESTASHDEVLQLEKSVNQMVGLAKENKVNEIQNLSIPQYFNLGELQKSYQAFQQAVLQSNSASLNGVFLKKKGTIGSEIGSLKRLHENALSQLELQKKDLEMSLEEAQSQQRLFERGFVSQLDAKAAMSKYLSKKQAYEQAKGNLENNKISQTQKQQEIYEIDKNIIDQKLTLIQTINSLKSEIEAWKQRYIVTASISGKVNILGNLQENQILKSGQELLYILPEGSDYYGEIKVGQYNFGKIKLGQEVIVKFQSYPFQEYGTVNAKINYIADVPKDSSYLVKVSFPKGLLTSSKKQLAFKNGMTGTGEIVTENLKLIEKFFYQIRKSLKR